MANLEMKGSFELTNEIIDKFVIKNKIGYYALGYDKDKSFIDM